MADSRFELIIFDNDGVLVDSEIIYPRVWNMVLRDHVGVEMSMEQISAQFTGRKSGENLKWIEKQYGVEFPAGFQQDFYSAQRDDMFKNELQPVPYVKEVIDALPIRACVASSSPLQVIHNKQTYAGISNILSEEYVFSGDMVENGKPAPDLFLHAAKQMGVDPSKCIVVEDAISGVQAAKAAGMFVVGFVGGSHAEHLPKLAMDLLNNGADVVIQNMRQLLKIL